MLTAITIRHKRQVLLDRSRPDLTHRHRRKHRQNVADAASTYPGASGPSGPSIRNQPPSSPPQYCSLSQSPEISNAITLFQGSIHSGAIGDQAIFNGKPSPADHIHRWCHEQWLSMVCCSELDPQRAAITVSRIYTAVRSKPPPPPSPADSTTSQIVGVMNNGCNGCSEAARSTAGCFGVSRISTAALLRQPTIVPNTQHNHVPGNTSNQPPSSPPQSPCTSRAQHAAQPRPDAAQPRSGNTGNQPSIIATNSQTLTITCPTRRHNITHAQSRAQRRQPRSLTTAQSRAQHAAQPRPDAAQSRAWEYGRLFSDDMSQAELRLLL